jgi:hypothetical protein
MSKKSFFAPIVCLPLLACGGDSGGQHITTADSHLGSGSGSGSGSNPAPCTATASYGAATFTNQAAETVGSGSDFTQMGSHVDYFDGDLNADALPDTLELQFWYGLTEFANADVSSGTFAISPDDADLNTCGLCAIIFTDQGSNGSATDLYVATAGSVTLSQATGSNFAGSVANLTFQHIDFDGSGNQILVDACSSTIASGTFTTALKIGTAASNVARFGARIHPSMPTLQHRHY